MRKIWKNFETVLSVICENLGLMVNFWENLRGNKIHALLPPKTPDSLLVTTGKQIVKFVHTFRVLSAFFWNEISWLFPNLLVTFPDYFPTFTNNFPKIFNNKWYFLLSWKYSTITVLKKIDIFFNVNWKSSNAGRVHGSWSATWMGHS